jgi:hypothetical protein
MYLELVNTMHNHPTTILQFATFMLSIFFSIVQEHQISTILIDYNHHGIFPLNIVYLSGTGLSP